MTIGVEMAALPAAGVIREAKYWRFPWIVSRTEAQLEQGLEGKSTTN